MSLMNDKTNDEDDQEDDCGGGRKSIFKLPSANTLKQAHKNSKAETQAHMFQHNQNHEK